MEQTAIDPTQFSNRNSRLVVRMDDIQVSIQIVVYYGDRLGDRRSSIWYTFAKASQVFYSRGGADIYKSIVPSIQEWLVMLVQGEWFG